MMIFHSEIILLMNIKRKQKAMQILQYFCSIALNHVTAIRDGTKSK